MWVFVQNTEALCAKGLFLQTLFGNCDTLLLVGLFSEYGGSLRQKALFTNSLWRHESSAHSPLYAGVLQCVLQCSLQYVLQCVLQCVLQLYIMEGRGVWGGYD